MQQIEKKFARKNNMASITNLSLASSPSAASYFHKITFAEMMLQDLKQQIWETTVQLSKWRDRYFALNKKAGDLLDQRQFEILKSEMLLSLERMERERQQYLKLIQKERMTTPNSIGKRKLLSGV
jgi:predicted  nucleic acid-binding Zn-ribbon protein